MVGRKIVVLLIKVRILQLPQKKMKKTFGKYKQKLYNKNVKSSLKRLTNIE